MNKVFVYGTLKKDYWNHYIIGKRPSSKFLGEAITEDKFLMAQAGFPYIFPDNMVEDKTSKPCLPVFGEVYEVEDDVLRSLDWLEGVEDGHYKREIRNVKIAGDLLEKVFIYIPALLYNFSLLGWVEPINKMDVECYIWENSNHKDTRNV